MREGRTLYFDFLKGIAILMVILFLSVINIIYLDGYFF